MKPRPYQSDAKQSIYSYFREKSGNPIVAMPTGTGKSIVIGDFVREVITTWAGQRIMMITHVKELIEQNYDKLITMWPMAPAGIYSAGLNKRESSFPVTFAGIGSVAKRASLFGHIDLLLIDECHLVSPKQETMYRKFIDGLLAINSNLKVIGFTATPYRLGIGLLIEGGLFTDVCYDITSLAEFNKLVDEGYLSPLISKKMGHEYNVADVRIHGGEFVQKDLQAAVDKPDLTAAALNEVLILGEDRDHWLLFAAGIDHAINVRDMLESRGISACVIHSKMSDTDRDEAIAGFKSGKYRAAVNNNVLTTGFDFPGIDLIGVLSPTQSAVRWVQMLGRGTRPLYALGFDLETIDGRLAAIAAGDKQNCLVLDFAGNTRRLGPINDPVIPRKRGKGKGEAPVRICDNCFSYIHASLTICPDCGFEFPRELKIKETASCDDVMALSAPAPVVEVFGVDRVVYSEHRKIGRPNSIKVTSYCGLRVFHEWVCLEHQGFARKKAREWWGSHSEGQPPATTMEALCRLDDINTPTHIRVWVKKKNSEVLSHDFTGTAFGTIEDIPRGADQKWVS